MNRASVTDYVRFDDRNEIALIGSEQIKMQNKQTKNAADDFTFKRTSIV